MSLVSRAHGVAFAALAIAVTLAACRQAPGDLAAAAAPPPVSTAVGPIPGPKNAAPPGRANPFGNDRGALADGRLLFTRFNCAGCHGDHAGGGMGPSLRDVRWFYGNADSQIFSTIAEGRAHGMPSWGTKLGEEQIWKLVAYIQSLRTPLEPEPPK